MTQGSAVKLCQETKAAISYTDFNYEQNNRTSFKLWSLNVRLESGLMYNKVVFWIVSWTINYNNISRYKNMAIFIWFQVQTFTPFRVPKNGIFKMGKDATTWPLITDQARTFQYQKVFLRTDQKHNGHFTTSQTQTDHLTQPSTTGVLTRWEDLLIRITDHLHILIDCKELLWGE